MVYVCDFDDSFTYNIFSEIRLLGLEAQIIKKDNVNEFLETRISDGEKLAIVLGPGPGHPDDYKDTIELIGKLLKRKNLLLFGVCLGHQMICRSLGLGVEKSKSPKHGEVELMRLCRCDQKLFGTDKNELRVQRYNSLAAKASGQNLDILRERKIQWFAHNSELSALKSKNFISYQFHPESVGTSFRSLFFRPLEAFLL